MQRGNRIFREMEERKFYVDWTGWKAGRGRMSRNNPVIRKLLAEFPSKEVKTPAKRR